MYGKLKLDHFIYLNVLHCNFSNLDVLKLMQELHIFENLKVMIIEDMIYLIHVQGLGEHVQSGLNSNLTLLLVDIEQDPPKVCSVL